jgi:UDP-N-acetylglucosamine 1-carboxyvinyltransferase
MGSPDRRAESIVVRGGAPLAGRVEVSGAKNSALKLMAAAMLVEGTTTLQNMPAIVDVDIMADLLRALGLAIEHRDEELLVSTPSDDLIPEAPFELVERIRASIVVLGPLLSRCGRARVALPGGDDFGSRPIDMHLRGLEAMGAHFELRHGDVIGECPSGLRGAEIILDFPSVGATENIVLAACSAKGVTVLDNAAREPEVQDLCNLLVAMGADLEGIGTPRLVIHGVPFGDLLPVTHRVVPDRVEAATYLACLGVSGGELTIGAARAGDMDMLLSKLTDMGMTVTGTIDGIWARADRRLKAVDCSTLPYPGVATDYKPMVTAMLSVADGVSIVTENLFSGRFKYVDELRRLGANIRTDAHHAVVRGVPKLSGAPVRAHDIRAGAAMVVAGLAAEGETVIGDVRHVDRGYAHLVEKLASVGADIKRR